MSSGRSVPWIGCILLVSLPFLAAAARGQAVSPEAPSRAVVSLDGPWDFATDPNAAGEAEKWFLPGKPMPAMPRPQYAETANGRITVPGCWDAQGYGTPRNEVRHNFVGKGWYKRTVRIPDDWRGRGVFLRIGGAHRYAKAWINGRFLGEHVGYLSAFEFDLTPHVQAGQDATVAIQVDSKQRWDVDALTGAADLIDHVFVAWGGLWGHVWLEARSGAWLDELFLQPKVSPAECSASAALRGEASAAGASGADILRLEVFDAEGRRVAEKSAPLAEARAADGRCRLAAAVPEARPWSPETPHLYTARLTLLAGAKVIDSVAGRFGLREIEIRGPHFYLNGKRLFLRGYGDDHIYPKAMAFPTDKALHLERLRTIKSYGFTHVRHHSTIMPPEYYDACDEVGMLASAEFPIAYQNYYDQAKGAAVDNYRTFWAEAIKRHRNHPSIFDWCMGNELYQSVPLAKDFRRIARELDPTRPFVDTDGMGLGTDRDTLDFHFVQFDVGRIPLDLPGKFRFDKPLKPVVSHESGNYVTFPRLDQVDLMRDNMKPFWLTGVRDRLRQIGLLDENKLWAERSERLYLLCHKLNIEAMRRNPYMSGYHWWLFQDYWATSNGLVDTLFRPKSITPDEVLAFNNDVVLLADGMDLTYRGKGPLAAKLMVSNFSAEPLREAKLAWRLSVGGAAVARDEAAADVGQGELATIATVALPLPDPPQPAKVVLEAELAAGTRRFRNAWSAWVYPAAAQPPRLDVPLLADRDLMKLLGPLGAKPIPKAGPLPAPAVYAVSLPQRDVLAAVERGACLLLLGARGVLPTMQTKFKPAWWKGNPGDNNCGTLVYDGPLLRPIAPDGWCDAGWYHLLEDASVYVLDSLPARPDVLIRSIPVLECTADRALLMQARLGEGSVILSGLNHTRAGDRPENQWLLARLVAHAATLPKPAVARPVSIFRDFLPPEGTHVPGFERVVQSSEKGMWHSHREDNVALHICRQDKVGNLVEWDTAAIPAEPREPTVTLAFAGGLGWRSQPPAEGFALLLDGKEVLRFGFADTPATWRSPDKKVTLQFIPKRFLIGEDSMGLFYLTVPRALTTPGEPCRLCVRSLAKTSKRWFGLAPYKDVE
jgi:beta-galactosidase